MKRKLQKRPKRKLAFPNLMCRCGHHWSYHGDGDHDPFSCAACECQSFRRAPKQDPILTRPEEDPGYGHGI